MSRLITLVCILTLMAVVLNVRKYSNIAVSTESFDFDKKKAAFVEKQKTLAELKHKREEMFAPKAVEEVVEVKFELDLNTPALQNGSKLYTKCMSCHGRLGQGKSSQKAPKIGGQHDWYVYNSLKMMKSGERVNKVMNPYIKNLSDQDMKDLGTYISKLPWN